MRMVARCKRVLLACLALSLSSIGPSPLLGAGASAAGPAPSAAVAVPAPSVTPLRAYRDGLQAPSRIATDATGHVYITDYALGKIFVRDEFGRLASVKDGLAHPLGIAVDAEGRIFVGEEDTGSVSVFLPNWSLLGKLGQGDGEFQMPNHIHIPSGPPAAAGMVFVSDSRANLIKVYSSGGSLVNLSGWSLIRQFGGSGTAYGQFDFPSGIFMNPGGELFVADQNNNRIQVFTASGAFLRSFGRSTFMGLGPFSRTQGLTGDSQGRIFVADTFQGTVNVIDGQGNAISTVAGFGDGPGELIGPTSLVIDRNNRLFVVSSGNTRVEILGLDNFADPKIFPAIVTLLPSTLFRGPSGILIGGGGPATLNLAVTGWVKVVGAPPQMIVLGSVTANGVAAQPFPGLEIGDFDGDGVLELRMRFDYKSLVATLPNGAGTVVVKGMLADGSSFEGSAPVRVITSVLSGIGGPEPTDTSSPGTESGEEAERGSR